MRSETQIGELKQLVAICHRLNMSTETAVRRDWYARHASREIRIDHTMKGHLDRALSLSMLNFTIHLQMI